MIQAPPRMKHRSDGRMYRRPQRRTDALPHLCTPDSDGESSMASSHAAPAHTWPVLLPWLDRLAPSELLALQRLGGPAQWWLRETAQDTSLRRADMRDVFDLFASFLESAPLADEALCALLPALPLSKATGSLVLTEGAAAALEEIGGPTLGTLGSLCPRDILAMHVGGATGSRQRSRSVLSALVREGVLLATEQEPDARRQSSQTDSQSEARTPGEAVTAWFDQLDDRQQDLIVHNLCASNPFSVEALAAKHRTVRTKMRELLAQLPQSLRDAAQASRALGRAVHVLEEATGVPVLRADLLDHHPWLGGELSEADLLVLDVLVGVLGTISERDGWLYRGQLDDAKARTLGALQLSQGESMSLAVAVGLLKSVGEPFRLTDPWIGYCGLQFDSGQIGCPPSELRVTEAGKRERSADDGYELAPPLARPVARQAEELTVEVDAVDATEARVPSAAVELVQVLEQLHSFAVAERPGATLADLLQEGVQLPPDLRILTNRFLAARPGPEGWALPTEGAPLEFVLPPDEAGQPSDVDEQPSNLRDRARELLEKTGHPLTSPLLAERIGAETRVSSLRTVLARDPRFLRSDVDAWALTEWGLRRYTNIKDLVAEEVDRAGGEISVADLVAVLTRNFSVKESSVYQAASTAPFTARGGVVHRLSDAVDSGDEQPAAQRSSADADGGPEDKGPSTDELIDLMGL